MPDVITNESFCAPIITQGVYDQAQILLTRRGRGKKRRNPRRSEATESPDAFSYLFTGRIRCSCGGNMTPYWSQSKGVRYHYYQCHRTRAAACPTGQVSAPWLHDTLVSEIKGMAEHPWRVRCILEAAAAELPDLGELTRQVIAARRESKRLIAQEERLTKALTLSSSDGAMRSVLSALESVSIQRQQSQEIISTLEAQIESALLSKPSASHFSALMGRFSDLWEAATPAEREILLRAFIVDIEIQGKKQFTTTVLSDISVQAKITKSQPQIEAGSVGVSGKDALSAPKANQLTLFDLPPDTLWRLPDARSASEVL